MKKKFSLKDALYNQVKVHKIALEIKAVYSVFDEQGFEREVLHSFPLLKLKARMYHIRDMLSKYLPNNYINAVNILVQALPAELDNTKRDNDFGDFIYAPYSEFIALHGCCAEHLTFSLGVLREINKRFSVEFAIRDFINDFPNETLEMLRLCSVSENYHERRLASEGLRPTLPWAKRLTLDYRSALPHLDNLFYDSSRYVTRSVANHLNDISKRDAKLVVRTLKHWRASKMQNPKEMDYITNHALRTLVKQGDEEALALLGYVKNPNLKVSNFILDSRSISIGEALIFEFILEAKEDSNLMLDYILHFKTKAGRLSPKVYKIKRLFLKKGEQITVKKRHRFKANMSTRKLFVGEHKVELQINGKIVERDTFSLKK